MNDRSRPRVRIFLVDDHPLVRQGLALLLEQAGFAIGGEADGAQGMLAHPGLASAQVVVLDLTLGPASGLELIPTLCRRGLRVVVYSMHEEAAIVRRALVAGASGYVTKGEAALSLVEAIRAVLAGGNYISPRAATRHP
jgi:DNA-binding NarL/FixJ family response regulator